MLSLKQSRETIKDFLELMENLITYDFTKKGKLELADLKTIIGSNISFAQIKHGIENLDFKSNFMSAGFDEEQNDITHAGLEKIEIGKYFLRTMLTNLLDNAIEASPETGKIICSVDLEKDSMNKDFLVIKVLNKIKDPEEFKRLDILKKLNNSMKITTKTKQTSTNGTFNKVLTQMIDKTPGASIKEILMVKILLM